MRSFPNLEERALLVHALRKAAEQFEDSSCGARAAACSGISSAISRYAGDARALAERMAIYFQRRAGISLVYAIRCFEACSGIRTQPQQRSGFTSVIFHPDRATPPLIHLRSTD
jgi:hypothetical protein